MQYARQAAERECGAFEEVVIINPNALDDPRLRHAFHRQLGHHGKYGKTALFGLVEQRLVTIVPSTYSMNTIIVNPIIIMYSLLDVTRFMRILFRVVSSALWKVCLGSDDQRYHALYLAVGGQVAHDATDKRTALLQHRLRLKVPCKSKNFKIIKV